MYILLIWKQSCPHEARGVKHVVHSLVHTQQCYAYIWLQQEKVS